MIFVRALISASLVAHFLLVFCLHHCHPFSPSQPYDLNISLKHHTSLLVIIIVIIFIGVVLLVSLVPVFIFFCRSDHSMSIACG